MSAIRLGLPRGARRLARVRHYAGGPLRRVRRGLRSARKRLSGLIGTARSWFGGRAFSGESALRQRLLSEGASLHPHRPEPVWRPWVNTALQTRIDVARAVAEIRRCGLPPHSDEPKNWDLLIALGVILDRYPRGARVLDAGAAQYSRLLPWLYLYGFRRLQGIDLMYKHPVQVGPIRYEGMDLTRTRFPNRSFDAITCLSVIEHGVELDAYFQEMSRLLAPSGVLITSTDFWCDPLDTHGKVAYGVRVKVFERAEIEEAVRRAARYGLRPTTALELRCAERAVDWARMELQFTFVNFVLERSR
jgi:2-polyprenyl-3-methyl-5-hydroxy-6-metoxy-1,4-benzoquinol methylase